MRPNKVTFDNPTKETIEEQKRETIDKLKRLIDRVMVANDYSHQSEIVRELEKRFPDKNVSYNQFMSCQYGRSNYAALWYIEMLPTLLPKKQLAV